MEITETQRILRDYYKYQGGGKKLDNITKVNKCLKFTTVQDWIRKK